MLAIWQQEEGSLAGEVLEEQVRMDWPGLAREVQQICRLTGLPDATDKNTLLVKASVEEAIKVSHLQYLKDNMKGQKLEAMQMTDMRERRHYTKL